VTFLPGVGATSAAAVVFDMDGLLVDSEPIWNRAQAEVLDQVGVDVRPLLGQGLITGMRTDEAVALIRGRLGFSGPGDAELADAIVSRVIDEIGEGAARLFPGAVAALEYCAARGLELALASGSAMPVIDAVLDRFELRRHFSVVVSAEAVPLGKPNPAVLLLTAHELGVDPRRCVVVEDAVNGCIAAKAARMAVIAIPEPGTEGDPRWAIADLVLESLVEFSSASVGSLLDDVTRADAARAAIT
jgi:mannitol-1-/sugar-/sorbitol-6-/2-deoxyglucose-6-phosphatase